MDNMTREEQEKTESEKRFIRQQEEAKKSNIITIIFCFVGGALIAFIVYLVLFSSLLKELKGMTESEETVEKTKEIKDYNDINKNHNESAITDSEGYSIVSYKTPVIEYKGINYEIKIPEGAVIYDISKNKLIIKYENTFITIDGNETTNNLEQSKYCEEGSFGEVSCYYKKFVAKKLDDIYIRLYSDKIREDIANTIQGKLEDMANTIKVTKEQTTYSVATKATYYNTFTLNNIDELEYINGVNTIVKYKNNNIVISYDNNKYYSMTGFSINESKVCEFKVEDKNLVIKIRINKKQFLFTFENFNITNEKESVKKAIDIINEIIKIK